MRDAVCPKAIILSKASSVLVSTMAKGCIVACVLPWRCFLYLPPNYIHFLHLYCIIMHVLTWV